MHKCKAKDCEKQIENDVIYCSIECYLYDGGKMNEPIQIREIKESECQLINPSGAVIGIIKSELQLNDVRLQITKKNLKGYSINWQDHKIPINQDGVLDHWPDGLFDKTLEQCRELLTIGYEKECQKRRNKGKLK
jgi:hypothetical protein